MDVNLWPVLKSHLVEDLLLGQLHQIEPDDVQHPPEWFWFDSIEVEGGAALQKQQEFVVSDPGRVQVDFQSQQESEQELVPLIQP